MKADGEQLLVELADRQLPQLLDPFRQLDQVALLLGARQRNALRAGFEPVDVEEPAPAELLRVGVVVLGPGLEELFGQLLGLPRVGGRQGLDVGKRLVFLVDLEVELGEDRGELGLDALVQQGEPRLARPVLDHVPGEQGARHVALALHHHLGRHLVIVRVVDVAEGVVLHRGGQGSSRSRTCGRTRLPSASTRPGAPGSTPTPCRAAGAVRSRASTASFWSSIDLVR